MAPPRQVRRAPPEVLERAADAQQPLVVVRGDRPAGELVGRDPGEEPGEGAVVGQERVEVLAQQLAAPEALAGQVGHRLEAREGHRVGLDPVAGHLAGAGVTHLAHELLDVQDRVVPQLGVGPEARLVVLDGPGPATHEVRERGAVRQPHRLDRREPRVVDGAAPGAVRPRGDRLAHRRHLGLVVDVRRLARRALDRGARRWSRTRPRGRAGTPAGAAPPRCRRSGQTSWSSTQESMTNRVPISRTDGRSGSMRTGRAAVSAAATASMAASSASGVGIRHRAGHRGLDGGRQLERRVVVGQPDQERGRLVDGAPELHQRGVPDERAGRERRRAQPGRVRPAAGRPGARRGARTRSGPGRTSRGSSGSAPWSCV